MKRLHHHLRRRYHWYDVWHDHPGHGLFHWIVFVAFTTTAIAAVFLNVSPGLGQIGERGRSPLSPGKLVGRVSDQILVAFKDGISDSVKASLLLKHELNERAELKEIGLKIVAVPPRETPEQAVMDLGSENDVDFAELDGLVAPGFLPDDPLLSSQWYLTNVNSPAAWDVANGLGVNIAIIDSGVDPTHPDLASNFIPGWNFYNNNSDTSDVYGHGTEVAGVVAAVGNNGYQVAGVAYGAKIMPLRVSDTSGFASYSAIATAINYAAGHGAKVINASYAVGGSRAISRAAKYARGKGSLIVISEGNGGAASSYRNDPNMISVSATDNYDAVTSWSTFGRDVDVSAPGLSLLTTTRGGGISYYSGTSFSAPLTAGVIALIWSANPSLSADQAQQVLFNSSADLGASGWDQYYGWGRVDAGRAVELARQ